MALLNCCYRSPPPCHVQVEAKYIAVDFKQQLGTIVQKTFTMVRDNVKEQIKPMLTACIYTPPGPDGRSAGAVMGWLQGHSLTCVAALASRHMFPCLCTEDATTSGQWAASTASLQRVVLRHDDASCNSALIGIELQGIPRHTDGRITTCGCAAAITQPGCLPTMAAGPSKHWNDVVEVFDALLGALKRSHVPPVLGRALFRQLCSYVNAQLLNTMLLCRDCCTSTNGESMRAGLGLLEGWIGRAGEPHVGSSLEELRSIRQVLWQHAVCADVAPVVGAPAGQVACR
jgi:hypothetical protein